MNNRNTYILTAVCGFLGTVLLIGSFRLNPSPPASDTFAQFRDFAMQHRTGIVIASWFQGIGSLLTVIFAIALIDIAGASQRIVGKIAFLSGTTILMISLVEIIFYLASLQAAETGDQASMLVSNNLISATQHAFLIAPALLLPLGLVLLDSNLLGRGFALTALLIGATLQVFGLLGIIMSLQPVIDILLIVQGVWFVAASVALLARNSRFSPKNAYSGRVS